MHHHRRDHEQCGCVGERDGPERAAPESLSRRHADFGELRGVVVSGRSQRRGVAVGQQAVRLGAMPHELCRGQSDDRDDGGRDEGCIAPADLLDQQGDAWCGKTASRHADERKAHGECAAPREPVDDGRRDGKEAGKGGADRHEQEGQVEHQQRVHHAERDEPERKEHHAHPYHRTWPEAVDHPALERAKQAVLDAREGEGDGQLGAAPAELFLELDHVDAEGVKHQRAHVHWIAKPATTIHQP